MHNALRYVGRHGVKSNYACKLSFLLCEYRIPYHRAEHWIVASGSALATCGEETFLLAENESTLIPIGTVHRLENLGKLPQEMIEVQSGIHLG